MQLAGQFPQLQGFIETYIAGLGQIPPAKNTDLTATDQRVLSPSPGSKRTSTT